MNTTPAHVESLFADAIARPPPEHEAFLARECGGDAALLERPSPTGSTEPNGVRPQPATCALQVSA